MKIGKSKIWSSVAIVIKLALICISISGIALTVVGGEGAMMAGNGAFLYFTIQSNIAIDIVMLVSLVGVLYTLCTGKRMLGNWWLIVKFSITVAIMVTFLVFFIVLAPYMKASYLLSYSNMSVHMLTPLLALADFKLFDSDIQLGKKKFLWGLAMPLYYVAFAYITYAFGVQYPPDVRFPYFFLDFVTLGWFSWDKGMGVAYWIILLTLAITLLSWLISLIPRCMRRFWNKISSKRKNIA